MQQEVAGPLTQRLTAEVIRQKKEPEVFGKERKPLLSSQAPSSEVHTKPLAHGSVQCSQETIEHIACVSRLCVLHVQSGPSHQLA